MTTEEELRRFLSTPDPQEAQVRQFLAGPEPEPQEGRLARGLRGAGRDLAAIADAALLGFPTALTRALEELGVFSEGAAEEMQEDIEAATPGAGLLGAVAPVALGFGGISAASRVPAVEAVRRAGTRPEILGGIRGAAGAAARAAPIAGAEGALIGAGEAEEDPISGAVTGGIIGSVLGGTAGGTLRGLGGLLSVLRRGRGRVGRVRSVFSDAAREVPERGAIEGEVRAIDQARRAAFAEAEQAAVPNEITDLARDNATIRRALRRSRSQEASDIAAKLDSEDPKPLTFQVAQDIRNDLDRTADAFRRRVPDSSGRVPSNAQVREAQEAVELLDEQLSQVPGYREGMRLTAEAGERRRALADGKKAFGRFTAEQIEDHLSGTQRIQGLAVPRSLEGQVAFRRSLLEPLQNRLRGSEGQALSAMRSIRSSPELQGKLTVALGPENAGRLIRFVEREARFETTERAAKEVVKYLGFVLAGSSLAGGALLGGELFN